MVLLRRSVQTLQGDINLSLLTSCSLNKSILVRKSALDI